MTKLTYKEQVTMTVLEHLNDDTVTFSHAMKTWWQNPRRDRAMRLTAMGDLSFRYAKLEFYDHDMTVKHQKSYYMFMMELSKKIKCPYYIDVKTMEHSGKRYPFIRLYDDRISMMLHLYGDLDSYLKSIKVRT